jgi:cytochrome c biogenesis protein CcmG/thiol:disulfide interchange protein DsbE
MVEHPTLIRSARSYGDDVVFLGVIYQDEPAKIQRFVERRGAWGPSLVDDGSRVAIAFGVYGVPETFVIDPQGVVVEKITGAVSRDRLDGLLQGMI